MKAELIDHMGTDLTVVNAARVSFNKESEELGIKDEKLIKYLASHNHFTPFTHCTITIREDVPIFVARQRFKHTVGFSYNEVSRRYIDDKPKFYYPDFWRSRPDGSVKQGSGGDKWPNELDELDIWTGDWDYYNYDKIVTLCEEWYTNAINKGVAPEQARMILPQSMYTSYYVTGSLSAWARAYKLRIDKHAQQEIQELAQQWDEIISPLFPVSWKELTK